MNHRACTTVLIGLCLATVARGEETRITDEILTSRGVTYRMIGVNASYTVHRVRDTTSSVRGDEESLARCDDLVAAALARVTTGGPPLKWARDRVVWEPGRQGWVDYYQRHQGYRVVGAGARVTLNVGGGIDLMGLEYDSGTFPTFQPKATPALRKVAARAVPRWITGPPGEEELMIRRERQAPPRLIYYVIFPVRDRGTASGWQVDVDAVTGKVLASNSTIVHATGAKGQH